MLYYILVYSLKPGVGPTRAGVGRQIAHQMRSSLGMSIGNGNRNTPNLPT